MHVEVLIMCASAGCEEDFLYVPVSVREFEIEVLFS